jgi:Transposase
VIAVGIDIAKRTHEACFTGQDGRQMGKARRFHNTRSGVRALLDDLQQLPKPATIGLEATGHYWLALHDELVRAGHAVQVLNPLQTHAYRMTTIRDSVQVQKYDDTPVRVQWHTSLKWLTTATPSSRTAPGELQPASSRPTESNTLSNPSGAVSRIRPGSHSRVIIRCGLMSSGSGCRTFASHSLSVELDWRTVTSAG